MADASVNDGDGRARWIAPGRAGVRRSSRVRRLAIAAACTGALGCGPLAAPVGLPLSAKTRFRAEWRAYVELPAAKALVVAGDLEGLYVLGLAYGHVAAEPAIAEAFARCERRRADRRLAAPCVAYAIGDVAAGVSTPAPAP
jgi:hypothetical protein